jgi:hypothetical protein
MTDRLIDVRSGSGMKRNAEKTKVMRILRQLSPIQFMIAKNSWRI